MSEQNSIDLATLRQDRADLDEEIAAAEARLSADGEEEPPEVESPTPAVTAPPTTPTALQAEIGRLESEGKWAEASPLKAQLVSGFGGLSEPAPTAPPALPTLADLNTQIAEAEDSKNWAAASALKSQVVQRRFV